MPDIELSALNKRYAAVTAVDHLTARVAQGRVTAFLGANGSGKTTTMRMLLGLSEPDSGSALIDGRRYRDLPQPLRVVGAVLDQGFHPNRSARNHLRIVAAQAGVSESRVDGELGEVGLTEAARRRVGGFSLGMRQRLNLAAAMIGDPQLLVLDEPLNGLDPAGIQWMRAFLRTFADRGGTVLLSSHLLSEIAHIADDAIIIDRGRLVGAGPVATLAPSSRRIRVTTPDGAILTDALTRAGAEVRPEGDDTMIVSNLSLEAIGRVARDARVLVTQMRSDDDGGLESVFASLIDRTDVVS
jgi:ABC-2 type transport system ATP-binding protein